MLGTSRIPRLWVPSCSPSLMTMEGFGLLSLLQGSVAL